MFDGDQLHQFIAASSRANIPLSSSPFPLHGNPSFSPHFDPNYSSSLSLLHHQEPPSSAAKNHLQKYPLNSGLDQSERSMNPWSNDEVLALLKLRSSMEIWFPDFTWEHVSRCVYIFIYIFVQNFNFFFSTQKKKNYNSFCKI